MAMKVMLLSKERGVKSPMSLTFIEKIRRATFILSAQYGVVLLFAFVHVLLFLAEILLYCLKSNLQGITLQIARAAAHALDLDVAIILFPTCRTLIAYLGKTPFRILIPSRNGIGFHKLVGWSMMFFACVHTTFHWISAVELTTNSGSVPTLGNLATGASYSGHIMLAVLILISVASSGFNWRYLQLWSAHQLFIPFLVLWSIHSGLCAKKMSKTTWLALAEILLSWMLGGLTYLVEIVLREVSGSHRTYISKVIQYPSNVVEIQIKKQGAVSKFGQASGVPALPRILLTCA